MRRTLTRPILYGASFALLVEEWLWTWTTRALALLSRFASIARVERWIGAQPPRVALVLLVTPLATLAPFKVLAFVLMYIGHATLGVTVLVVDKLVVTALFARIWQLTEPAVTRIESVRWMRDGFLRLRRVLHAWLERQPAYLEVRSLIRRQLAGMRRRRSAARRVHRRRDARRNPAATPARWAAATSREISRDR